MDKIALAEFMISLTPSGRVWKQAKYATPSTLMMKRYSLEGNLVKLTGRILTIRELPPIKSAHLQPYDIILLAKNQNTALGFSSIELIYLGDSSTLVPKKIVTCAGCFVGIERGTNALGGTVEAIVLVGNVIHPPTTVHHNK